MGRLSDILLGKPRKKGEKGLLDEYSAEINYLYASFMKWKDKIDIKGITDEYFWREVNIKLKDIQCNIEHININTPMYEALKKDIKKNGLGGYPLPVRIDSNNNLMDGNHRIKILKELYDPEHKVLISQQKFPTWIGVLLGLLYSLLLWLWDTRPVNKVKAWAKSLYRSFV